jgi:hypothetical protein
MSIIFLNISPAAPEMIGAISIKALFTLSSWGYILSFLI